MKKAFLALIMVAAAALWAGGSEMSKQAEHEGTITIFDTRAGGLVETNRVARTDEEWQKMLSPEAYTIMRKHGTERPFSCGLLEDKGEGTYTCAGCDLELFVSANKFDSGTGWPSFYQPIHPANIGTTVDYVIGYARTEVHCARCGGHLGHVFDDGPRPTGQRYCINGAVLQFLPAK